MPGETDLDTLLRTLSPEADPRPFVFVSLPPADAAPLLPLAAGMVREAEGVTLVLPEADAARHGLEFDGTWARVTLTVHSSLAAVGPLAAVAAKLAAAGISVNPLAGVYHDHLFVLWADRERAVAALADLARDGGFP